MIVHITQLACSFAAQVMNEMTIGTHGTDEWNEYELVRSWRKTDGAIWSERLGIVRVGEDGVSSFDKPHDSRNLRTVIADRTKQFCVLPRMELCEPKIVAETITKRGLGM